MDAEFLLIQKMKRGEEQAFELFVRKHYEEILRYCSYHCPDSAYAEDLTQETFFRFFTKLSDYRHMGKVRNFLYTIAGNLCRDYYKRQRDECILKELPDEAQSRQNGSGVTLLQTGSAETEETGEEGLVERLTVEAALTRLPKELKEVIILYYFQDLKLKEISEALQIGLPLVKYRMRQAKAQLKLLLQED